MSEVRTADLLKGQVADHQKLVKEKVARLVEEFETAVKGNSVLPDIEREAAVLCWTPLRKNWSEGVPVTMALLDALSEKSGMIATWNGCSHCAIRFRERPKVEEPVSSIKKEDIVAFLKGLSSIAVSIKSGEAPSDAALEGMASAIYDNYLSGARHQHKYQICGEESVYDAPCHHGSGGHGGMYKNPRFGALM
jgi:hypothetical protein